MSYGRTALRLEPGDWLAAAVTRAWTSVGPRWWKGWSHAPELVLTPAAGPVRCRRLHQRPLALPRGSRRSDSLDRPGKLGPPSGAICSGAALPPRPRALAGNSKG